MQTWIFQGNPKHFDIDTYLKEEKIITWSVRQKHFVNQLQSGDIVYIWRSDGGKRGTGGIVAKTIVVSEPYTVEQTDNRSAHWTVDTVRDEFASIDLDVLDVDLAPRIKRIDLLENEPLANLLILRNPVNTNYLISKEHATILQKLWDGPTVEDDLQAAAIESGRIEGKIQTYYGQRYERNAANRKRAIEIHGTTCQACGFDFEKVYGERGRNFIEVHHIKPLHITKETLVHPETDLIPLCANCHRMIHRDPQHVLTVKELKELLEENRHM
ncbi:EVE domain-containing protein [Kurthia senegalensis]|uniref:EVE domain-containing protein n=1 Tax=Kurthia senegalensis TaxID=1033740 RepID=UPI000289EF96|nr:EVE domain-containing protein [Kurthia senegalensis]